MGALSVTSVTISAAKKRKTSPHNRLAIPHVVFHRRSGGPRFFDRADDGEIGSGWVTDKAAQTSVTREAATKSVAQKRKT
jgi:hypothetical protein